ncbi:MAG: tRNA (uracil-5-)-methyltransferase [Gammaproteobacteria bacterium]|jgi:tRNA (uracil-5-)-methyltransferase
MPLSRVNSDNYQHQLTEKADRITQLFQPFRPPTLEVFSSPSLHYRMRAEFRIWHQDDSCFYAMFKKDDPKTPCRITSFDIGSERICQLMPLLLDEINTSSVLKERLFQIEFLTTLGNQALVTLIYHKKLDDNWEVLAKHLQTKYDINIIGRSKKQRLVLERDFVTEVLTVNKKDYFFQQVENSFTQPNASVNQKMLNWALSNCRSNGGDLLELYCGNGNFTAVLAQNFSRVLCTEISKTSVKSANINFDSNNIDNVSIARMSSEEISAALNGEREFRRLKNIDLTDYNFSTVLVDPPRAGLDNKTEEFVKKFEHILYISCNPETLSNNLANICESHSVVKFAIFDQFPYTDHIECGVTLKRH